MTKTISRRDFLKGTIASASTLALSSVIGGTSAMKAKAADTKINVMVWDRGNAAPNTTTEDNALTQWIREQMQENYGFDVEYTSVPRSESDDKVNIMMAGGSAPDIVFTYSQSLYYSYASQGGLKDLTDLYAEYGGNISEYCSEANEGGIAELDGVRYAVMKQRGTASARHTSYIRKDWLDELGLDMPTTKEELETYLYAVKDAGLGTPWAMSGRSDTEEMYLNFVGSYVTLEDDRTAYIYNEYCMAVAPGAEDGLRKLNEYYNAGLITQEFYTDTDESSYLADLANGKAGFCNGDTTEPWDSINVLNTTMGEVDATFQPIMCFDLPEGGYRTPYEYRYAMFVMIPVTTSDEKAACCMQYLNWLADPANAVLVRYTPDLTYDELGCAVEPTEEEKNAAGYPGTCDDLCIMNLNFDWVNDYEIMAQSNYANQTNEWASVEWYENYYEVCNTGKYIFPSYGYISDAEATYGTDVQNRMLTWVYNCISCSTDDFDSTYQSGYDELVNAGLQKILDARAEYYDSL